LPDDDEPRIPDHPRELEHVYRQALHLVQADCEPTTWEAFRQVTLEGRAPSDVAHDLGISRNAVYIAKSRVLSGLRTMLAELTDGAPNDLGD
jgi:RNA polymerase sigma-70 factor (ECF subfamily)